MSNIRVRIAPSPTGKLHIGTARVALFNYLFTRQNKGEFILRIEDTDISRIEKEFEEDIVEALEWLGLDYDECTKQSEHRPSHIKFLQSLINEGKAYTSKEKKEDTNEIGEVVRFKNPNTKVSFHDTVRGEIIFDTTELGDFIIARKIDDPLYHFASVVDDGVSKITHIIRGDDHISNTARQILIQEALGFGRPQYTHLPLIHGKDGKKLSKRNGAVSITELKEEGYLRGAVVNYLAMLSWNSGTEQEFFTMEELIQSFKPEQIQKGSAIFNTDKLNWFNSAYIKKLDMSELREFFPDYKDTKAEPIILNDLQNKIKTIEEGREIIKRDEYSYLFKVPIIKIPPLIAKNKDKNETKLHLQAINKFLEKVEDWREDLIKETIWQYATEKGRSAVLWPMRYALSGSERSLDPFSIAEALEKKETIKRIKDTIDSL